MLKSRRTRDWEQGFFTPAYPDKCLNLKKNKKPIYRSSWELRFMNFCDTNKNVICWGSELIEIPYLYELDKNQKLHKYYPDIYCEMKLTNGSIKKYLIEIKPEKQTRKPQPPKRKTNKSMKNYRYALAEFTKNKNKWLAVKQFCDKRDWTFKVLTENTLNISS